jgi:Uncharacterized conserved protein
MTLDDFKKEKIAEMKARNTAAVTALNVVINKLMLSGIEKKAVGTTLTDADVVSVLQKSVKELEEERDAFLKVGRDETVADLNLQIDTVKKYLPKLLSEEEIKNIILAMEDKSVPSVMRRFKTEYAGKVDMGVVNKVLKSL